MNNASWLIFHIQTKWRVCIMCGHITTEKSWFVLILLFACTWQKKTSKLIYTSSKIKIYHIIKWIMLHGWYFISKQNDVFASCVACIFLYIRAQTHLHTSISVPLYYIYRFVLHQKILLSSNILLEKCVPCSCLPNSTWISLRKKRKTETCLMLSFAKCFAILSVADA